MKDISISLQLNFQNVPVSYDMVCTFISPQ